MFGFGLLVLGKTAAEVIAGQAPQFTIMAGMGSLALVANTVCGAADAPSR